MGDGRTIVGGRKRSSLFISITSTPILKATKPPVQWISGIISQAVKWAGHEFDNKPPSSSEVKKDGALPPLSHTPSWRVA
jgi:hypothetical protein